MRKCITARVFSVTPITLSGGKGKNFKFLITSRLDEDIRAVVDKFSSSKLRRLEAETHDDLVDEDIKLITRDIHKKGAGCQAPQ